MKNCEIDADGAGGYAQGLLDGARRFCLKYPTETWKISGVRLQEAAISLNATDGKRTLKEKAVYPVLQMADAIFDELENFRNSN